ncbi:Uncharacterized conserved protein [Actinomyces bovis]|uniref:Uncharacterized conserved protein n=1 Tax=Actinomyces bovis TaxID=1658 RepID=A0ABY1VRI3_9ACTO|nr:hypothetical protein [Actinomyces bovis]SPT54287.1 Uncharacterized conserved protein [Actinomyces bovis]VEG56379.1 Uncharacterized conserved protein [Actinomyces israelii]
MSSNLTDADFPNSSEPGTGALAKPDDAAFDPSSTLTGAPEGRRRSHLSSGLLGILLPPVALYLIGMALISKADSQLLWTFLILGALLLFSGTVQAWFALRSSVGNLVAGIVALMLQVLVLLAPNGAQDAPFRWARELLPYGALLVLAAWFLGASWAMRQTRRAGRKEAQAQVHLAQADVDRLRVPTAPPSRRSAHLLSFFVMVTTTWGVLRSLPRPYARLVDPQVPGVANVALVVCCLLVLLAAMIACAWSSFGMRATAILLAILALPAVLGESVPGHQLYSLVLPGLSPVVTLGLACVLSSLGWGLHMARRQGRFQESV